MDMTISAVQLSTSSQPQTKTSESGFSDVLTEVRTSTPQTSSTPSYTEAQPETNEVQLPAEEMTVSAEATVTMESFSAEFKETVVQLIAQETGISPDDTEKMNAVIDALLEILKKMAKKDGDETEINPVMELLAAMVGGTDSEPAFTFTVTSKETTVTAVSTEIDAILSTEKAVSYEMPVQAEIPAAPAQTMTAENAPADKGQNTAAQPEINADTAAVQQTAELTPESTEKLLNDILSAAKKDLGLTKAEFTQTAAPEEMPVQAQSKPATVLPFNHKDGTNELNSILGMTEETTEPQEVKIAPAEQNAAAMFAGNAPQQTETVKAEPDLQVEAPLPEQQLADEILSKPETLMGGRTEFTMELNPESLGKITVKLVSTEGRVEVNITAENDTTRQLLENRAENIGAALRNNGVELERYQVVSGQEEAQLMQESYDGSSKNPYGRNDEEQQNEEGEDNSFLEILQQL